MRRNIDIFTQTHAPHSSRFVAGFDSINSGSCAVGFIAGQYRRIPALVTETATDDDQWRVVNLKGCNGNEAHFDAIAVLGAVDDQQATDIALMQFGRLFDSVAMDVLTTNTNGLIRHLDTSHYHAKPSTIAPWQLKAMQDVICAEKPMWDDINLLSHKGQTANLLLDIQRHDDYDGLLSQFDGLPHLLEQLGVEEPGFDALIVQYQYLEKLTAQLHTAMKNAGKAGVQVVNATVSKPFKRNKVAQVAVTYDLEDEQSVIILFHNPDSTPSKLAPADTLISWKIQLNSRDITGAIQPNQGEGIALPVLAGRILKLVNQNSDRFKRNQAKKTEQAQALTVAEQRITDKTALDKALDDEMTDLQQQIDAANEQAKQQQELAQQNSEALKAFMADIATTANLDEATTKNYFFKEKEVDGTKFHLSVDPFAGGLTVCLSVMPATGGEQTEEQAFTLEQLQNGGVEEAKAYLRTLDEKFNQAVVEDDSIPAEDVQFVRDIEAGTVDGLAEENFKRLYGIAQETKTNGDEETEGEAVSAATVMADKLKPAATEKGISLERLNTAIDDEDVLEILDSIEALQAALNAAPSPEPAANPDQEFLQKIIAGTVDATTVDMDHIIELAEKYQADEAMNALVEQALETINQAEQAAAQSVA